LLFVLVLLTLLVVLDIYWIWKDYLNTSIIGASGF